MDYRLHDLPSTRPRPARWLGVFIGTALLGMPGAQATEHAYRDAAAGYGTPLGSNQDTSQLKARWYRYYHHGQPSISTTITEQHLRNGYEVLDRNMQVIKRVGPYNAATHAQQKARQEAQAARQQANMQLRRIYGSAAHASSKRDQLLAEMETRKTFLNKQLADLQDNLNQQIAQAANLERQQKPLPAALQKSLGESRLQVQTVQQNISAISQQQQQTRLHYQQIIQRLNQIP